MKENSFIHDIYKSIGFKVDDKNFLADGFFFLQGILVGITLNDIWRIFQLPGENKPVIIGNQAYEYEIDFVYQLVLALAMMASSAFGVKHAMGMGTGMALGSTIANHSEVGKTISLLPFKLDVKT